MKKIATKVITVSSQIFIVVLFLLLLFSSEETNNKIAIIDNNNFKKMADRTSILFKEEDRVEFIDDSIIYELNDSTLDEEEEDVISSEDFVSEEVIDETKEEITDNIISLEPSVIETYTGILTGYGPDCTGCGNYNTGKVSTASGYHVANIVDGAIEPAFNITYDDSEYGEVRIVAADSNIPFYSIVRITVPGWDPFIAIVLDRGSTVGFENCRSDKGCLTNFDLLYPTEAESLGKTKNVTFELLRSGE